MFQVDYSEKTDFPLLEEGEHDAIIHSIKPDEGPQGTYLRTRFSVIGDALNRQAWMNISLADGALWRVKKMARDLGVINTKKSYKSREAFEAEVAQMFTGRACRITVEHQEFEGVVRNRVTSVSAPDAAVAAA